jgi:transposase
VETSEKGTTGTCPRCGAFHRVGTAEIFTCPAVTCTDIRVDRDVNGARNNLLWAYTQADHWQRMHP